jgi:hypothetical protein
VTIMLTDKEALFIAALLDWGGLLSSRRIFEGMEESVLGLFTDTEKENLSKSYHRWNGDPEDYIENYFEPEYSIWLHYFAAKLRGET